MQDVGRFAASGILHSASRRIVQQPVRPRCAKRATRLSLRARCARCARALLFLWVSFVLVRPVHAQDLQEPALLPWSQQMAVREAWLEKRHALILPMMRAHGIGMWIVVNEEFHDDPLTEYVAPPRPYAGNRDIFVFVDAGEAGLRKLAITGYAEENLKAVLRIAGRPAPPDKRLPELWTRFKPAKIALGLRRAPRRAALAHQGHATSSSPRNGRGGRVALRAARPT